MSANKGPAELSIYNACLATELSEHDVSKAFVAAMEARVPGVDVKVSVTYPKPKKAPKAKKAKS